jgi:hypothetical protein
LGPPVNDASAIDEFGHARAQGATHAVIGWPSLWWRDNYVRFYRHITERYACALENSRMIAFDLRVEPGRTPQEEGAYA